MAKKASVGKVKNQAVKPVVPEETQEQEEMEDVDNLPDISELSTEEIQEQLNALIAVGQEKYEEVHGENTSLVPRFFLFWENEDGSTNYELANLFMALNRTNRFPNAKRIAEYTEARLENRVNDSGEPIPGTSRWKNDMPANVVLDESLNLHNSQKNIRSGVLARQKLERNAIEVQDKTKEVEDLQKKTGLTPSDIQQVCILEMIPDDCADYVDMVEQRTNADRAYRSRYFADYDWSELKASPKADASPKELAKAERHFEDRLPKLYQECSKILAAALSFGYRRRHDNGCMPRNTPSYGNRFTIDRFRAAIAEMPDMPDSVFWVRCQTPPGQSNSDKRKAVTSLKISAPYLALAHYLASMHDATFDKKEHRWVRSKNGYEVARDFMHQLLRGKDFREFVEWRQEVQGMKDKGKIALNNVFNSLGFCWRHYAFKEPLPSLKTMLSVTDEYSPTNYAHYSKEDKPGSVFDAVPKVNVDPLKVGASAPPKKTTTLPQKGTPKIAKR